MAIWVFVQPIHFQQACLATTLHMVAQLIIAQDMHIGAKNIAAATLLGPAWLGCVLGGGVVSLAHAPGYVYTLWVVSVLCSMTAWSSGRRCVPSRAVTTFRCCARTQLCEYEIQSPVCTPVFLCKAACLGQEEYRCIHKRVIQIQYIRGIIGGGCVAHHWNHTFNQCLCLCRCL